MPTVSARPQGEGLWSLNCTLWLAPHVERNTVCPTAVRSRPTGSPTYRPAFTVGLGKWNTPEPLLRASYGWRGDLLPAYPHLPVCSHPSLLKFTG